MCQPKRKFSESPCQSIPGAALDAAIGELVLEAVSPAALEVSLDVQRELSTRLEEFPLPAFVRAAERALGALAAIGL